MCDVSKCDDCCIQNEELCTENEEFCIKNDEFCIKNDDLCSASEDEEARNEGSVFDVFLMRFDAFSCVFMRF